MGMMLLVFAPIPYMDATSSWAFRSRWKRAFVGAAGMISEIFVAAVASFVWAYTGTGTVHSLAYNMMFIASVSTLLFNANPLLRFDGYYILSDLLDIPNLSSRAFKQLRHIGEKYLFGYRDSSSGALNVREATWLSFFGLLSGAYRVLVFTGIVLFVADKFFIAGLIMAAVCVVSWLIVPIYRFINYLISSPRLAKTRPRAAAVSFGTLAVVFVFLAVIPFPNRFRAPGVLEAVQYLQVVNDAPGYVQAVLTPSGEWVREGTPLMQLKDQELEFEINATRAQRLETSHRERGAFQLQKADLEPIRKRLEVIESRLLDLEQKRADLLVKARQPGIWVAPQSNELVGAWIPRGSLVGEIVNEELFRFSAVVSQNEAASLFVEQIHKAEVRLYGQAGTTVSRQRKWDTLGPRVKRELEGLRG